MNLEGIETQFFTKATRPEAPEGSISLASGLSPEDEKCQAQLLDALEHLTNIANLMPHRILIDYADDGIDFDKAEADKMAEHWLLSALQTLGIDEVFTDASGHKIYGLDYFTIVTRMDDKWVVGMADMAVPIKDQPKDDFVVSDALKDELEAAGRAIITDLRDKGVPEKEIQATVIKDLNERLAKARG